MPLALVSGVGLRAALDWARRRNLPSEEWAAIFVIGFTLFSITINAYNLFQYHKQSTVHSYVFYGIRDGVNKMNVERAIVFAPLYWKVWSSNPSTKAVGAYVYDWPHPHPDGRDKIVYMSPPQNSLELEQVATRWPEHVPVFLRLLPQAPWMEIIPFQDALEEGGEKQ